MQGEGWSCILRFWPETHFPICSGAEAKTVFVYACSAEPQKGLQRPGGMAVPVGKADGTPWDRASQPDFHQAAIVQVLLYKFPDHASHSQADSGKLNEQVHGGHLQRMVHRNPAGFQIIVNVGAGNVVPVQKHDIAYLE